MADPNPNSYESKQEAIQDQSDLVRVWLDAINRSSEEEKDWRTKDAEEASKAYSGAKESHQTDFNIFHSNVETLVPALYNSTPVPDVRRRFGDNDPAAKQVSDIFERAISTSIDSYDFDCMMETVTGDMAIPGRGVARVRYVPYFSTDPQTQQETIAYEEVPCEHVHWRDFRRGPGRAWPEVPWVAFRLFLSKDELAKLVERAKGDEQQQINIGEIPLNYTSLSGKDEIEGPTGGKGDSGGIFKRALVWEIWDKESREVLFICPDHAKQPLKVQPDPLELEQFFPLPRPMQALKLPGSLIPITQLSIYRELIEELNEVSRRIRKLVSACRAKGGYASSNEDIAKIAEADDTELVALTGVEHIAAERGLESAIVWWPLDAIQKALATLYQQREIIKQAIYEVTGIADILRGATNPNETLGAQQLKAQWGSLRIQKQQKEVARFARDLFRLKAEIIANKFQPQTIQLMTGIQVTPEIQQLLQNDTLRNYRVDIESDSTIRADLIRNQQTMSEFLNGTASFASAMGPILQMNPEIMPAAISLYSAFARQFNLGKSAEDALEKLIEQAGQPQQPKQDPAMKEVEGKLQIEQQRLQIDGQMKQGELQLKGQETAANIEMGREKLAGELALKREKIHGDHQVNKEKAKMMAMKPAAGKGGNGKESSAPMMPMMEDHREAMEQNNLMMATAVQVMAQSADQLSKAAMMMAQSASAPKRTMLIRDESGKAMGAETTMETAQ